MAVVVVGGYVLSMQMAALDICFRWITPSSLFFNMIFQCPFNIEVFSTKNLAGKFTHSSQVSPKKPFKAIVCQLLERSVSTVKSL